MAKELVQATADVMAIAVKLKAARDRRRAMTERRETAAAKLVTAVADKDQAVVRYATGEIDETELEGATKSVRLLEAEIEGLDATLTAIEGVIEGLESDCKEPEELALRSFWAAWEEEAKKAEARLLNAMMEPALHAWAAYKTRHHRSYGGTLSFAEYIENLCRKANIREPKLGKVQLPTVAPTASNVI